MIACRPNQWTKNLIVFAAPLFTFEFVNDIWLPSFIAFFSFCFVSSAIYLINDCIDIKSDQIHPVKKRRPIASGLVSKKLAIITSFLLLFFGILCSIFISWKLL